MNNAKLYRDNNGVQKRDAMNCLREYHGKIKWNSFDRVMDIGCGDGTVTTTILKKFMHKNFKKLVGCDISENMVKFANEQYGDDRTTFCLLDIEGNLPEPLRGNFEHVFSFYTLHWIHDQERAFANIYQLLSEGGDCLLVFLGNNPLYNIYRLLAQQPKWKPWLNNVDHYVSPYHDMKEPESSVRRIMSKAGFKHITVESKTMSFVYNTVEICRNAVRAINPFKISAELLEEFLDDYLDIARQMRLIHEVNNNIGKHAHATTEYSLLVAYGRK